MNQLDQFLHRAENLLARLEAMLPPAVPREPEWGRSFAFRWRRRPGTNAGTGGKYLQPVLHASNIALDDLRHIQRQKEQIEQNTRQFVQRRPANNVLLTGARGTGKSSLIKACLNGFAGQGLRLIEVDKADLADLPDIVDLVAGRPERFVIFCDDLSFEEGEAGYKALKVALDGSVAAQSDNVLIYATSNRRHLMPEKMSDNAGYSHGDDGDLHPGETVEEKISLSERFGLWLSFYPFKQDDYLDIVAHWLQSFGCTAQQIEEARADALRWALQRGSRSGRVAWQFAKDYAGKLPEEKKPIDVAVGILMRGNGDVLLGQRPEGKPYAGYWEFPGGKVEQGEDIFHALQREFVEELGVHVVSAEPWCCVEHVYEHAHVRLYFYISREWEGEPQSLEGQAFAWQGGYSVSPLLPATIPLLEWLDKVRYPG